MDAFNTFGVDPIKFLLQTFIWFLILGVPAIMATKRVFAYKAGPEIALWLAFIWLVPLFGAYVTLHLVKSHPETKSLTSQSS